MIYVALLRGINVGGHTKVEMPRLKTVLESIGCTDVLTYINSGNVIFRDDQTRAELTPRIEAVVATEFGVHIPVVLRDLAAIETLVKEIPNSWTNDTAQKTDVMFLWDDVDRDTILESITINPTLENVRYIAGAIVWNIGRENVTRGGGVKLIKLELYKHMTVRNVNTVRKLYQLMKQQTNTN